MYQTIKRDIQHGVEDVRRNIQHGVEDVKRGARKELIRYVTYIALAIIGAGIIIAFASSAFDALFRNVA